jgi:hypothetical protein
MSYDTGEQRDRASRWANALSVPLLLVIGWVLYELTAQPALGVAAVCVKFGWEDFRTAWWLRRRDPDWKRGRACFWLYIASGWWKLAISASLMIFAYIFLKLVGALGPGAGRHVAGALLTAFAGIVLAAVMSCWAITLALFWHIKLWLNSGLHTARRHDRWPSHRYAGRYNGAGLLLGTSLFATFVPVLLLSLVVGVSRMMGPLDQPGPAPLLVLFGFPALCALLILALVHLIRRTLRPRVFAATAKECWGAAVVEEKPSPVLYAGDEVAASRLATSWGERGS